MTPATHQKALLAAYNTHADNFEIEVKAYLQALLDDAGVKEAVAKSQFECSQYSSKTHTWADVNDWAKDNWRDKAQAALDAIKAGAGVRV